VRVCVCACVRFVSKLITTLHNARAYETVELCVRSELRKVWLILYHEILLPLMGAVIRHFPIHVGRPDSSVGIATDYGLGGLGSNPGGDEIFRPSSPAPAPTQPPVRWVPGLSRG